MIMRSGFLQCPPFDFTTHWKNRQSPTILEIGRLSFEKKYNSLNMFQRLVNYWLSTFITERLLASPLFHRMAAKTHHHVSTITDKSAKTGSAFVKAFKENLEKERRR